MGSARLTPTIMSARFFASSRYAVVGASTDRAKFGNKVLRWYQAHGLPVSPINPVRLPNLPRADLRLTPVPFLDPIRDRRPAGIQIHLRLAVPVRRFEHFDHHAASHLCSRLALLGSPCILGYSRLFPVILSSLWLGRRSRWASTRFGSSQEPRTTRSGAW